MRYGHYIGTNLIYSPFFTVGVLLLAITGFFILVRKYNFQLYTFWEHKCN